MLKYILAVGILLSFSGQISAQVGTEEAGEETQIDREAADLIKNEMTPIENSRPIEDSSEKQATLKDIAKPAISSTTSDEKDIPVFVKKEAQSANKISSIQRLVLSFGVVALVVGVILIFARFWAKRKHGLTRHNQIKVLTQYPLGPKKSLAIIRVAGESILIGVTDHNINLIKSLALLDEDLPTEVPHEFAQQVAAADQKVDFIEHEAFSFGGVKDIVANRIREMRSL